jgi:hypothetical protein
MAKSKNFDVLMDYVMERLDAGYTVTIELYRAGGFLAKCSK